MPGRDATRDPVGHGGRTYPTGDPGQVEHGAGADAPDAVQARRLCDLLCEDQLDAAIDGGLARFQPLPALDAACNAMLSAARDRLLAAWAARERYRARDARLERIATERLRARGGLPAGHPANEAAAGEAAAGGAAQSGHGMSTDTGVGTLPAPSRPALPAAAAAALARARARASGQQP
ncbi:hypothetical protein WCE34_00215 [Luteimonas sp. MJ204]|uniref:hypothetical protein n=1 Tax=Luteimonas sp. MJ145 TaxID=3129234 RepID=UPI0031BA0378